MTEPLDDARGELAAEIDAAFEKYLNATNSATKEIEARELRRILWDNTAGIIAHLRPAPVPRCEAEPVDWHHRFREPHQGAKWGSWKRMSGTIEENKKLFAGRIVGEPNRDETKVAVEFAALFRTPPSRSDAEPVAWVPEDYHRWLTPHGAPAQAAMMWKEKSEAYTTPLYAATPSRLDAESAELTQFLLRQLDGPMPASTEVLAKELSYALLTRFPSLVSLPSKAGREEIARVIDEHSFDTVKMHGRQNASQQAVRRLDDALAKADAIRALSPDPGTVAVTSTHHHTPTKGT